MPTPILEQISKDLAYKLQDPVGAGTTNGVRLSADERLRYITRAYRRLLRMVTRLFPGLIERLFNSYYNNATLTSNGSGVISNFTYAEIFDAYVKDPNEESYTKAVYISPIDFLDVKTGQNKFYEPDLDQKRFFWTRQGTDVLLLPPITLDCWFTYRQNIAAILEDDGYGGVTDIDVPTEHTDLLLSLACAEAYLDIGQPELVTAYKNDAAEQLMLLSNLSEEKDKKDKDEER